MTPSLADFEKTDDCSDRPTPPCPQFWVVLMQEQRTWWGVFDRPRTSDLSQDGRDGNQDDRVQVVDSNRDDYV
jgi:hypothetical protein